MGRDRSGIMIAVAWLGLLVVLVLGAVGLHAVLPLADGPVAVGVVAALLWLVLYGWQTHAG